MKHYTELKVGDEVWGWEPEHKMPVPGTLKAVVVIAQIEDHNGREGAMHLCTLTSENPLHRQSEMVFESADDVVRFFEKKQT